jgi:hypothetical protein
VGICSGETEIPIVLRANQVPAAVEFCLALTPGRATGPHIGELHIHLEEALNCERIPVARQVLSATAQNGPAKLAAKIARNIKLIVIDEQFPRS